LGPFQFLRLKAVAVTSYWPNIRTTVAELNVVSLSNVIEQLGGKLLFALAIIGILLLLLKDKEGKRRYTIAFFMAMWLVASLFATTKGVRFILQATPVMAIALGTSLGLIWNYSSHWISKELKLNFDVTKILVFILLAFLLIKPAQDGYSQAYHSAPAMNDGWYDALNKINLEAPQDIVITSWWDFGHWFKAIAQRPVTFDGGTQTSWGAYWVGKSLLTDDEKASVGIVRMLNCGQNNAFEELNPKIADVPKTIDLLNEIVVQDKNTAAKTLQKSGLSSEDIDAVLKYTHCDAPVDYYITSGDMIGKAGVWGHFGSWDFKKAVMYLHTKNLEHDEAVSKLMANLSLSENTAEQYYTEIKTTSADNWISPWPGYISGVSGCQNSTANSIRCTGSLQGQNFVMNIDLDTLDVRFESNGNVTPNSIVYPTKNGVQEKKFSGNTAGFSVILIPDGENYSFILSSPSHAATTFTRLYFLDRYGMECFSKYHETTDINGGKIITWKVDYQCLS
ncbi:MAG: STT3 domain-containing protein, partial [Nanoarchaeota archaeon]